MPYDASPIDAVITWVDGDDPAHGAKLQAYLKTLGGDIPASAGPTRFRHLGELEYCVASVLRFAHWIRTVYIVTDNQTPAFLKGDSGRAVADKVALVDHTTLFRGYEEVLPVFNSRAIEAMLWRIPGLADRFISFNDDMMLCRPVKPGDFFREGNPVLRGRWTRYASDQWLFRLIPSRPRAIAALRPAPLIPDLASHLRLQELSARALGFDHRYFQIQHEPRPARRDLLAELYEAHPEWLRRTIEHKLRHPEQLWSFSLAAHQAIRDGQAFFAQSPKLALIRAAEIPSPWGIDWQLRRLSRSPGAAFVCIQSLDMATPKVRDRLIRWMENHIGGLSCGEPAGAHARRFDSVSPS
jgi:hypothetical protein